jgi:predicted dehydrogenase
MAAAIVGGGAPPVTPQDALVTLDVIEAARRSTAGGEVVAL